MDGFTWWWIIWGLESLFFGVCVGLIMLIAMKRKGAIALCMLPLLAWQFLWSSWQMPRTNWLFDWWYNYNDYSIDGYRSIFFIQSIFFWICVLLALIPALAKDKSRSDSPSKPATAASPSDAYAKLSEE